MARVKDAKSFADKYVRRTKAAVEDYKDGINSVTEAPGKKAVAKADKYINGVNQAFDEKRWQRNTEAVSLQEWQKPSLEKGARNFPGGVEAAKDKVQAFAENLLAYQEGLKREIDKMDDSTPEARIQKAVAWMEGMRGAKGKLK